MDEKRKEYLLQYEKENIRRIPFNVRRSDYEELKAIVDKEGVPMNAYIKKALNAYTGQEIFKA
jgi:hypothetical protein|nr:MAG TPA: hypothetical protein [Caudoviricetes sp.]